MPRTIPEKTVYYQDEWNVDFAGTKIQPTVIDQHFRYHHKNPIWRFFAFLFYYCIAFPLIWIYERVFLRVKFVNKKALKKLQGKPCFFYGNHTGFIDAFTPNLLSFPRSNKILVSPDTVSIPCMKNIVQMLGAIPVPTHRNGFKNFLNAVERHHKKSNITIYPEAHIWPYYTGVRKFKSTSFAYPVKLHAPIVVFFTAYTKPKGLFSWFRKANVTVYVSEPIYPDESLSEKAAQNELCERAYAFMKEKSAFSNYELISYVKVESDVKQAV